MANRVGAGAVAVAVVLLAGCSASQVPAGEPAPASEGDAPRPSEAERPATERRRSTGQVIMTERATGTFRVRLTPVSTDEPAEGTPVGRMSLDKEFEGDIQGVATGEMLTAVTAIEGSAGYVAMERVSGMVHGRSGTFVLQHHGIMTRGDPQLTITVVPDSGTGELRGIAGAMTIDIRDGEHSYVLEYTLPGGS